LLGQCFELLGLLRDPVRVALLILGAGVSGSLLDQLPDEFREVIVLREMEDLSYKEIAAIARIPIGTVMSRLARARKLLLEHLRHTVES